MIVIFPDPVAKAISYLSLFYDNVLGEEPDGPDYNPTVPHILVGDGGGPGVRSHSLLDARLIFDIRCTDRAVASDTSQAVAATLRDWEFQDSSVTLLGGDTPKYSPDADRRLPAYLFTFTFAFRGQPKTLTEREN